MSADPGRPPRARGPVLALYSAEQEPPHNIEAEQAVLGAFLLDPSAFEKITGVVSDKDFWRDDHRRIFRHVARLIRDGKLADVVTVDEAIKASEDKDKTGGIAYLVALAGNTPSSHNVRHYAAIVAEHAERRRGMGAALELHDRFARGDLDDAGAELQERASAIRSRASAWGRTLDLAALAQSEPTPPRHIFPGGPAGYAWMLSGHGGQGKSAIELHRSFAIATGREFFGMPVERRRVLYLSCEDRADLVHLRLARICRYEGVDLASLDGWLTVVDLVGVDAILWERDPRSGHAVTAAYHDLEALVRRVRAEVLVVDGIADTFGGSENARGEVKRFVNALLRLVPANGALILVGHVAKATASSSSASSEGYSGSTAWHNSVRARWFLRPEFEPGGDGDEPRRTGALVLDLQKSNIGPVEAQMRFRWDEDAQLFVGERLEPASAFDRHHREKEEREGVLRAFRACAGASPEVAVPAALQGPRTAHNVLSARPEFPESLRSGRPGARRFRRILEDLRQSRKIEEGEIRRANRHTATVLRLVSIESASNAPIS